jgi:hypothetical protein
MTETLGKRKRVPTVFRGKEKIRSRERRVSRDQWGRILRGHDLLVLPLALSLLLSIAVRRLQHASRFMALYKGGKSEKCQAVAIPQEFAF